MLNKNNERELAYVVRINDIKPIQGSDNCECAVVNGWNVMVRKNTLKPGDLAVYFEIDSKLDITKPEFAFLISKKGHIKTQKYTFGGKGSFLSQGLLMPFSDFGWEDGKYAEGDFLTKELGITYYEPEDNVRKSNGGVDKYKKMAQRNGKLFSKQPFRWLMRREWGKKLLFVFFGKKRDKKTGWPVGRFPGVSKTDQERAENMPWVLNDKTPFIVTQKCDGSSGTFILEKKLFGYEFYVCSRNIRMMKEDQECFYGNHNYYWEVAKKYDIENKMKNWLKANPKAKFVCWQGEVCAPAIQSNPQALTETHLYCFHWTDGLNGRRNIIDAAKDWKTMNMEVVPIVDTNYIMPDNFEDFKLSADGMYDSSVCEGNNNCPREGFVYYKTTDPNFSFKNVSREYLLKH